MSKAERQYSFLRALAIERRDIVCLIGAGGKTSLLFRLAAEARQQGDRVLATTSTRMFVPAPGDYDAIDLSGTLFAETPVTAPGIYVGGQALPTNGKMAGPTMDSLLRQYRQFDLVLIEADGAAGRPLKGWNMTEPVIPGWTTQTVGIIDIQAVGSTICSALVHRLDLFLQLTGARAGQRLSLEHLSRMVLHRRGLFGQARGRRVLYVNKVETDRDVENLAGLKRHLPDHTIVAGSLHQGVIHV